MEEQKFGLAYYNKKDWIKFINSVDDRKKVENTWEEWKEEFDKFLLLLKSKNINFEKVEININDMVKYLKERKLKNIGKNRSLYVAEMLRRKYE